MSLGYPKVTIGIPTCNRASLLGEALASALSQTYVNIEIVVSDNASTDNTKELLTGCADNVTVIFQANNIGMTRNWEACLNAATGEYFLLLSDDDYLEPDAVQRLMDGYGTNNDSFAFVYGRTVVQRTRDKSSFYPPVSPPMLENALVFIRECYRNQRFASAGAVLFRTREMCASGGYSNGQFDLVSDCAMMFGICLMNPNRMVKFVDTPVFNYRVHDSNLTSAEKLDRWVDEISRLAQIVCAKLSQIAPRMCQDITAWLDWYVVSFVFGLAMESCDLSFGRRCRTLVDSIRVCRKYIGVSTLKLFACAVLQLMTPRLHRLYLGLR